MSTEPQSPKTPANPAAPAPAATHDAKPVANASGPAASSATAPSNAAAPVAAAAAVAPASPSAPATPAAAPAPSAQEGAQPAAPAWTPPKPLANDQVLALLTAKFPGLARDPRDQWDLTVVVPAEQLRSICLFLRHEPTLKIDMLLDVVGVDYLSYPNHRDARFAVIYAFKGLTTNQRVKLKVWIEEEHPHVPSLHDLFKIADWMEREVWDQVGIVFDGHPNPKRLLNHHEFVGHPLRKDYPCQKRQKLSVSDPLVDQLTLRLRENGYTVLDDGGVDAKERFANRPGDIDGRGDRSMNDPDLQSTANGQRAEDKRGVL